MEPRAFYERPFVVELQEIFEYPNPPAKVTEKQFDGFQEELEALSQLPWHEVKQDDCWVYLYDLRGVVLQQDLFDYLFPAVLISWRDSLITRDYFGGDNDLCSATLGGEVLYKRMSPERRERVVNWIANAFLDGVDFLLPLEIVARAKRNDKLHFFLETFNALGSSVHMFHVLLPLLLERKTPGALRFWLTLCAGLAWRVNEVPWVLPANSVDGGGGIYLFESASPYLDRGFIRENLDTYKSKVDLDVLLRILEESDSLQLTNEEHGMVAQCTIQIWDNRAQVQAKMDWYFATLATGNRGESDPH